MSRTPTGGVSAAATAGNTPAATTAIPGPASVKLCGAPVPVSRDERDAAMVLDGMRTARSLQSIPAREAGAKTLSRRNAAKVLICTHKGELQVVEALLIISPGLK